MLNFHIFLFLIIFKSLSPQPQRPHHPGFDTSNPKLHSRPEAQVEDPLQSHEQSSPKGRVPVNEDIPPHMNPTSSGFHHNPRYDPSFSSSPHSRRMRQHPSPSDHSFTSYQSSPQQTIYSSNRNSWYSSYLGAGYQIMMIFFLVGLIYNCLFGRNQNDKHAIAWFNANKQYFEERFEKVGLTQDDTETEIPDDIKMNDSVLIKENPYFYRLYCANYRYVKWLLVALEFRKRFDASSMMTSLLFNDKDKLIYQVSFEPVDPLGWIFCVCKKREANLVKKSYGDINYFCNLYEPSVMCDGMCLLSESLEVFMELFDNKNLFPYYKQIENYLDAIYFSDQVNLSREPFTVIFSFDINLTYSGQDRKLLEITHFVNLFVDTLAQLKYSKKFKEDLKKNRIMYERSKMEEGKRKEIEEKEKRDFIEKWKIKNKMKGKKGLERRRLQKELEKYD